MSLSSLKQTKHILQQVAEGKEEAFRVLFDQYHQKIYTFALYLTHSEAMAEEVTQEVFIKVWTNRLQLPEIQYFSSWIKTLARNHIYTLLRHLAVERRVLEDIKNNMETQISETSNDNFYRKWELLLKAAVDQLPPRQKEVYQLSRYEGMKQIVIAEKLGLSIHTVKNHMKAALHSIHLFLEANKKSIL